MSRDNHDSTSNPSHNETLAEVVARVSRREFLRTGVAVTAAVSLDRGNSFLSALPLPDPSREPLLGFKAIPISSADAVTVPNGYSAKILIAWGDPVSNGPAFSSDASNTAAEQAQQGGMHNGMLKKYLDTPHQVALLIALLIF